MLQISTLNVLNSRMALKTFGPLLLFLSMSGCTHASSLAVGETCKTSSQLQSQKSQDLKRIVQEDQADRTVQSEPTDWKKVNARDSARRQQVASIASLGCLATAADYAAAALVFQHGSSAEDYQQAFTWALEAVKLGDDGQRSLVAATVDRYLVSLGKKQLFGTQVFSSSQSNQWCLEPIEKSFPEKRRLEYLGRSVQEYLVILFQFYRASSSPSEVQECAHNLQPSPAGTVPGFW